MFEDALNLKYGVAGICVMLTLLVLVEVGKFVWGLREKKDSLSDVEIKKLTMAVEENTASIKHLEGSLGEVQKLKTDVRRYYTAIKMLAGERWPEIRDEILDEEKVNNDARF